MLPYQSQLASWTRRPTSRWSVSAGRAASVAPKNDHQFATTVRHRVSSITSTPTGAIVTSICARNWAPIWPQLGPPSSGQSGHRHGGVSDPLARPVPTQMRGRPGRSRPSLPPLLSTSGGPAGTKRRPIQTRTSTQAPAAVTVTGRGTPHAHDRRSQRRRRRRGRRGADGQPQMVPPLRPRSRAPDSERRSPGRETGARFGRTSERLTKSRLMPCCCRGSAVRARLVRRSTGYRKGLLIGVRRGRRGTGSPAFFLLQ
jgi:hypothetical protein